MNETPISNPFDEDERAGKQPILWTILGLTAMCGGLMIAGAFFWFKPDAQSLLGQYFPSATPTSSSTPLPTATPNWTATAQVQNAQAAIDESENNWETILTDTFDNNDNNWLTESSDDEYASTNYDIVNGAYRWETTAHQPFIGWVRFDTDPLTNFYLSVEVTQVEGPDTADYGIIFREDDDTNFYYFAISEQGAYVFYVYYEEWDVLIDWTKTDLLRPGTLNRITVIADGSHFTFFINEQYLTEFTDDRISEGPAALAVELSEEGDQAVFEFDNLELRRP